jgi:hypothetical protein
MSRRAIWQIQDRDSIRKIIYIVDNCWGNHLTITNDAEQVLNYHKVTLGLDWRVVYKDTEGEWWEIVENKSNYWMGTALSFERWEGEMWDILKNGYRSET